jgi:hypothetical protein
VIHVRRANELDLSNIVAFGKQAVAKTSYASLPYNASKTRAFLKGAMKDPSVQVFVAIKDHNVCGVLIGSVDVVLFSHVLMATDLAFIADAGGELLLDRFLAWAKQRGAAIVEMVSSQAEGYERYSRLLEHKGFERSGGVFRLTLVDMQARLAAQGGAR